ncbi:MAG TPA: hypothetical protein VG269_16705 [Tepidisphaeraceae bacterium]|nr:hypothetical protein [Tepidisphaeraceae bacterium]
MYIGIRTLLAGITLSGVAALCGCDVYTEPGPPPPPAVGVGVGVDTTYYDRGWYDGPYYYYEDREGHRYHELREEHERRLRDRNVHVEHHEEHEHR